MTEQEFRNFFALGLCIEGLAGVREPVAYLYGGLRLPKIPEVEGFKYATIQFWPGLMGSNLAHLYLFDTVAYWGQSSSKPYEYFDLSKMEHCHYTCDTDESVMVWTEASKNTYDHMNATLSVYWANFDIPTPDGTGVAIEATAPIPVYE